VRIEGEVLKEILINFFSTQELNVHIHSAKEGCYHCSSSPNGLNKVKPHGFALHSRKWLISRFGLISIINCLPATGI